MSVVDLADRVVQLTELLRSNVDRPPSHARDLETRKLIARIERRLVDLAGEVRREGGEPV